MTRIEDDFNIRLDYKNHFRTRLMLTCVDFSLKGNE